MFYREILRHKFDFSDDEIIENYVSLLKGLAVNLDSLVLKNYLVRDEFSLLTAAMSFANHKEWLIKTASKTVILKILSREFYLVNFPEIDEFVVNSGYFTNLINHFKVSVDKITENLKSAQKVLQNYLNDLQESIYYFNDIFSLNKHDLSAVLCDSLLRTYIFPVLISGILENHSETSRTPLTVCLYTISKIIKLSSYQALVSELQSILFSSRISKEKYLIIQEDSDIHESEPPSPDKSSIKNPVSSSIYHYLSTSNDNVLGLCLYIVHVCLNLSIKDFLYSTDLDPNKLYENLADALSHVLIITEQIRFYSFYFASKVLFELSAAKDKESEYHREHDVIKFALQKKIKSLQEIMKMTTKRLEFIRFFESEWEFIKELKWVEVIDLPVNYLMHSNDRTSQVPLHYRHSLNQDDAVITEIRLFLLFRKLKHMMIRCEIPESSEQLENPMVTFFKSNFEIGKEYFLNISFLKGKDLIEVRSENMTKFIVDDLYFFILGCKTDSNKTLKIESVCRYSKIRLVESLDSNEFQFIYESKHFSFKIEDYFIYTSFKSSFKCKIEDCLKKDLELLRSFISKTR